MTEFITKYRWLIIFISLSLGIAGLILIPFAETDPEIRNYVPEDMISREATDSVEKVFGGQDMLIVLFSDSLILIPENLEVIEKTDKSISKLEGAGTINSLFSARNIKSEEGMMIVDPLIKEIPTTPEELKSLEDAISENRFARNIVISSDFTTAAITANLNKNIPEHLILSQVDSIISSQKSKADILTGGLPIIRKFILKDVNQDAVVLIPLALIIMLTILKISLGEWKSVMIPFSVVILSTAFSIGLFPLLGWKISIISLLLPVIIIAVANNYGIYLVSGYQLLDPPTSKESRFLNIRALYGLLNMPILFSGLTTVAGTLGLLSHSIIPARQLGWLSSIGITLALLMSLLLVPALIYISPPSKRKSRKKSGKDILDRAIGKISEDIISNPGRVLIISALVTIAFSSGISLLKIDTDQEHYFPAGHPVRKASEIINSRFGGSQTISVMINAEIKDPDVMHMIDDLTIKLRDMDGVGNVLSISDVVREMSKALYDPEEDGYDKIPVSQEAIAQMFELYYMSGEPDDFSQLMDFDNKNAHIIVRISDPSYRIIREIQNEIETFTKDFSSRVTVGGYAIIMADFSRKIINGQILSLAVALVTVFILLSIIFRSVRGGLTGSIPLAASIIIQFGAMGAGGIAIDAATALLSSIMIGVGVDFTIQFLWRYKVELESGKSHSESIIRTFQTTGRSIAINALSVMAGFSATFFSGFLSIRYFGYMVLISIGSCFLFAVIVIPAFMLYFKPQFIEPKYSPGKTKENN